MRGGSGTVYGPAPGSGTGPEPASVPCVDRQRAGGAGPAAVPGRDRPRAGSGSGSGRGAAPPGTGTRTPLRGPPAPEGLRSPHPAPRQPRGARRAPRAQQRCPRGRPLPCDPRAVPSGWRPWGGGCGQLPFEGRRETRLKTHPEGRRGRNPPAAARGQQELVPPTLPSPPASPAPLGRGAAEAAPALPLPCGRRRRGRGGSWHFQSCCSPRDPWIQGILDSRGTSLPRLLPAPSRALEFWGIGALLFGGCSPGRSPRMLFPPSPRATGEAGGEEGCSSSSSLEEEKKPQGLAAALNHPELIPLLPGLRFGGAPGWLPHFCTRGVLPALPAALRPLWSRDTTSASLRGRETLLQRLWRICTAAGSKGTLPSPIFPLPWIQGRSAPLGAPSVPGGRGAER